MTRFQRLLKSPVYRPWFDQVNPIFWPVLYWQLECTFAWMKRTGIQDVMLTIRWWGWVEIVYVGDKRPDPSAYRPYKLSKPRWDNPCWESDVPVAIQAFALATLQLDATLNPPLRSGGGGSPAFAGLTVGALPIFNTS